MSRTLPLALILVLATFALGCAQIAQPIAWVLPVDKLRPPTIDELDLPEDLPEFNRLILEVCNEYPTDGTHSYWWPRGAEGGYDGCTRDLYLFGERVMSGEEEGRTFCCGLTAEVFLVAYNRWLEIHGEEAAQLSPDNFRRFLRLWFVVDFNGPGPNVALEEFDLGHTIPSEEWDTALPGDPCNYWRTERDDGRISGHSVIFLEWVRDDEGEIAGIHYFSSQPGTDGIGYRTEMFGANGGLSRRFFFLARAEPERGLNREPEEP